MRHLSATEFKAKCLALIDEVGTTGETIVIEKRGRPVAQLQAFVPGEEGVPQFTLRGSVRFIGDITKPALSADDWESTRSDS